MWIRKTKYELKQEQSKRRLKFEIFVFVVIAVVSAWVYWKVGSIDNFLVIIKRDPEQAFALLFFPLFIYLGYRNYVLHGSAITAHPGKICLSCGDGMSFSDDGWGFKVYGPIKRKWYQIRACNTPEKCDIAYQFEVKWVEDAAENG